MRDDFIYDVFISHNSRDKPRVRKLAERLRQAGLQVWFDEWNIRPGEIISLKVDEGLEQSRVLLLCISPNALSSGWVALERSTAIHRDPSQTGRRFIPLLLADCRLPDSLRRYKFLDFREQSEAEFDQLLAAIRPDEVLVRREVPSQKTPESKLTEELSIRIACDESDLKRAEQIRETLVDAGFRVATVILPRSSPDTPSSGPRIVALLLSANTNSGLLRAFLLTQHPGPNSRLIVLVFDNASLPKELEAEYSIMFSDDTAIGIRRIIIELSA